MRDRLQAFLRFLLGAVVAVAANVVAGSLFPNADSLLRYDLLFRPLLMVLLLLGFSFLLMTVDHVPTNPLAAMGLATRGSWRREAVAGLLLGVFLVGLAVAALAAFGRLSFRVHLTRHALAAALVVLFVLLTGALAEELMFRGYPFQRLVEAVGPVAAVILLSVLFGAVHLMNPHASRWGLIDTALVGVLLSLAYLRTGALWMPWGVHFAWNAALGLGFGLPVSGLTEFSVLVRTHSEGPPWLTGASYGIEASATAAVVILAGIAFLVAATRRTARPAVTRPLPSADAEE